MVVISTHASDDLSTFLLGDHSSEMIDNGLKSLLLVPQGARYTPIKKIALAIDPVHAESDLEQVYQLIPLAKDLHAELLITYIQPEKEPPAQIREQVDRFLMDLSNKADYPNIYYRVVTSDNTEKGLKWLCENGQVDMLAMLHRQHGFFDSLLNGSHTQRLVNHLATPLLVIPA